MALSTPPSRKRKRTTDPKAKRSKPKSPALECPICLSPKKASQLIRISTCNCACCRSCLCEAFGVGLTPSNFPARCCGHPLDLLAHEKHLTPPIRRAYRSKIEEHQSNNALYCAKPSCGEYLMESTHKDKFATCGMCHKKTCVECKILKGDHLGVHSFCPRDTDDLRELSERNGWRRCPRCVCLVERIAGCDEIRCICKAYFCYKCGKLTNSSTHDAAEKCTCHDPINVNVPQAHGGQSIIDLEDDLPTVEELLPSRRRSPGLLPADFPD